MLGKNVLIIVAWSRICFNHNPYLLKLQHHLATI